MAYDRWQAPDRDSPSTLEFHATVELGAQLDALLKAEGKRGTNEGELEEASGASISRPRRWHKMFERMGLLYPDDASNTQLTALGSLMRSAQASAGRDFRRAIAGSAIEVLRKYQLRNPADRTGADDYPEDADLHPYWAIWKAAVELDGRLHWDELNRVLMWVLRHQDLDSAIATIRQARADSNYNNGNSVWSDAHLGPRAYEAGSATTDGRSPEGQVRDQKMTPWFKRAALGELLFSSPGTAGRGFWSIHPDIRDLLDAEVARGAPAYTEFTNTQDWFKYYGCIQPTHVVQPPASVIVSPHVQSRLALLESRMNVVYFGPPGTGKTHAALEIASEWASVNGPESVYKVTFHPSYGYEEFVQGYRPKFAPDGGAQFALQDGILLEAATKAQELSEHGKSVLLFIDEINRGDVARIFGELITYIEPGKRGVTCTLAHTPKKTFAVPKNLYFLGTMNTADKSISLIDIAMRRRFAFVSFPADPSAFEHVDGWVPSIAGVGLREILTELNARLASEGIDSDRSVGQALLAVEAAASDKVYSLRQRFEFDILPLISEYCYMDRSRIRRVLGPLVDEGGNPSLGNVAEFEARLKAWLGHSVEMPSTANASGVEST